LTPEGLALAVVNRDGDGKPRLERCEILPLPGGESPQAIAEALRDARLMRMSVSTLMSPKDYQLSVVEAPNVAPAELRAAMRWKLREAVEFPVEDAVIDVFDVPPQGRRTQGRMVYAIVARREHVEKQSALFAGIPGFDVIDVPELALRNLASILPASAAGVALLYLADSTATVVLVRGATFYFARQMQLPQSLDMDAADGATSHIDAGAVALELQRSLDYYERNHDQPPITNIVIAPGGPLARALAEGLARETGLRVSEYDLNECFDCASPVTPAVGSACLLAIGAALRNNKRQL
jgi:MSHA biogenesis protein MshI